jgi:hypothetical protein
MWRGVSWNDNLPRNPNRKRTRFLTCSEWPTVTFRGVTRILGGGVKRPMGNQLIAGDQLL